MKTNKFTRNKIIRNILIFMILIISVNGVLAICGDSVIDFLEVCDNGVSNGVKCTPAAGQTTCDYCSSQCQGLVTVNTAPLVDPVCCAFDFLTFAYDTTGGTTLPMNYAYIVEKSDCTASTSSDYSDYAITQNSQQKLYNKILENCDVAPACAQGMFDFSFWAPRCVYNFAKKSGVVDSGCNIKCSVCGDGVKSSQEQCDNGVNNGVLPTLGYSQTGSYCKTNCQIETAYGPYCGDGVTNGNEQCDGTVPSTFSCTSIGMIADGNSMGCDSSCNINAGCIKIPGWYVNSNGWSFTSDKLIASGTSAAQTITSDAFDIFVGEDYVLSANLITGSAILELTTTCISSSTSKEQECNINYKIDGVSNTGKILVLDTVGKSSINVKIDSITPKNPHSMNNGLFFKNVKLVIKTTGATEINQISLKQSKPSDITYDVSPAIDLTGCCPSDYCWDGTVCVDSKIWMDDASKAPIWNNLLIQSIPATTTKPKIDGLEDNHVDTSNQPDANGYRCVITDTKINDMGTPLNPADDTTTKIASWAPSKIKYDWNYEKSGYCSNSTDCFVNYADSFIGGSSKGCTANGTVVDDEFVGGKGNHFCYNGAWTTKSYIIASLLQGMAIETSGANTKYSLSCYDDLNLVYNDLPVLPNEDTLSIAVNSACVYKEFKTPKDSQVVTGVVLHNDEDTENFVDLLISDYNLKYGSGLATKLDCISEDAVLIGGKFSECVKTPRNDLRVYYDTESKYFIISNKIVSAIDKPNVLAQLWGRIKAFFSSVLGIATIVDPYDSIGHTTSYDRIYVLRTGPTDIDVTAIEEKKYDEDENKVVTVMYVTYSGALVNTNNNPINKDDINRMLADSSVIDGNVIIKTDYFADTSGQKIVVKSEERTGIWQYFTTILRVE